MANETSLPDLELLEKTVPFGIVRFSGGETSQITYISEGMLSMLRSGAAGEDPTESLRICSQSIYMLITPEERGRFSQLLDNAAKTERPAPEETELVRFDGTTMRCMVWITAESSGGSCAVFADVDEWSRTRRSQETRRYIQALSAVFLCIQGFFHTCHLYRVCFQFVSVHAEQFPAAFDAEIAQHDPRKIAAFCTVRAGFGPFFGETDNARGVIERILRNIVVGNAHNVDLQRPEVKYFAFFQMMKRYFRNRELCVDLRKLEAERRMFVKAELVGEREIRKSLDRGKIGPAQAHKLRKAAENAVMVVVRVGKEPEVNFIFTAVSGRGFFQAGKESLEVSRAASVNDDDPSVFGDNDESRHLRGGIVF